MFSAQIDTLGGYRCRYEQPQQKSLLRTKNGDGVDSMNSSQRSKDSSALQTPAGANGDCRIYPTNVAASTAAADVASMSPSTHQRGVNSNAGVDVSQRLPVWPTADQHCVGDENDNEGKWYRRNIYFILAISRRKLLTRLFKMTIERDTEIPIIDTMVVPSPETKVVSCSKEYNMIASKKKKYGDW